MVFFRPFVWYFLPFVLVGLQFFLKPFYSEKEIRKAVNSFLGSDQSVSTKTDDQIQELNVKIINGLGSQEERATMIMSFEPRQFELAVKLLIGNIEDVFSKQHVFYGSFDESYHGQIKLFGLIGPKAKAVLPTLEKRLGENEKRLGELKNMLKMNSFLANQQREMDFRQKEKLVLKKAINLIKNSHDEMQLTDSHEEMQLTDSQVRDDILKTLNAPNSLDEKAAVIKSFQPRRFDMAVELLISDAEALRKKYPSEGSEEQKSSIRILGLIGPKAKAALPTLEKIARLFLDPIHPANLAIDLIKE